MKKELILKFWNDSVWSKVISVGIVAIISFTINGVTAFVKKQSFYSALKNFWNIEFSLWQLLIFFSLLYFISFLINKNSFNYDDKSLELDRELYKQIRAQSLVFFLETSSNGFSSRPVKSEIIGIMFDLFEQNQNPSFIFLNPTLENLKKDLMKQLDKLDGVLNNYIFGARNGWVSIPSEWEYEQPERMIKAKKEIKKEEDLFTKKYIRFITKSKQILKI